MRGILFVIAMLGIAGAGVIFVASRMITSQNNWAYQVCNGSYGLCDHPLWLGIIVVAAACVVLGLKATEI
jgi:hypothetical protein